MRGEVLLVDNYDSFTYNLAQAFAILGAKVTVKQHDEISVAEAIAFAPTHLIISPGPGRPENAGISIDLIKAMMGRIPILGVCLGHQAIAQALGGTIDAAQVLMHGKSSPVYHDGRTLFEGLQNPFNAGRYHSLSVSEQRLPEQLAVSAYTSDGEIMGVRHRSFPIEGVQFHPESVLTPEGDRLLRNFMDLEGLDDPAS